MVCGWPLIYLLFDWEKVFNSHFGGNSWPWLKLHIWQMNLSFVLQSTVKQSQLIHSWFYEPKVGYKMLKKKAENRGLIRDLEKMEPFYLSKVWCKKKTADFYFSSHISGHVCRDLFFVCELLLFVCIAAFCCTPGCVIIFSIQFLLNSAVFPYFFPCS